MKKSVFSVICAAISIQGCSSDGLLDKFLKSSDPSVPVKVEEIAISERSYEVRVPAVVKPSEIVEIVHPSDIKVTKVFINRGDTVEIGENLISIAPVDSKSSLEKLTTDLKEARAEFDKQNYLFENRDRLLDEGRIDQLQYDALDEEITTSEERLEKIQTELNLIKDASTGSTINSQLTGVVSDVSALVGMVVPAGKSMASIIKVDPISVEFDLESYEASTIEPGMRISLRLPDLSGQSLKGTISKIGKSLNPDGRTFKAWASVPNSSGYLKVGMNAEVEFKSDKKQRFLMIPVDALIREKRRYYVFTVIGGTAHKVEVVPKEKIGDRIEIAQGLKETDLVITKGHDKLREGAEVEIWAK